MAAGTVSGTCAAESVVTRIALEPVGEGPPGHLLAADRG